MRLFFLQKCRLSFMRLIRSAGFTYFEVVWKLELMDEQCDAMRWKEGGGMTTWAECGSVH